MSRFVSFHVLLLLTVFARHLYAHSSADRAKTLRHQLSTDPEEWLVKFNLSRFIQVQGEESSRSYHVVLHPDGRGSSADSADLEGHSGELLAKKRMPAILMLHGYHSDAALYASVTSMAGEGSRQGYVMVYLDGAESDKSQAPAKGRCWNSGACGGHAFRNNVPDTDFVSAVVADLVANLGVDARRVFVAGMSNGGSMALRLACERPDLFAAVSSVHGSLEFRDGRTCATACNASSGYCLWDSTKEGCTLEDWATVLPSLYTCTNLQAKPVPMLVVNGYRTPSYGDGGVYNPTQPDRESWPPLAFQQQFFTKVLGCDGERSPSFRAHEGEEGAVKCHSFHSCQAANLTFCEVAAGDWWYGSEYYVKQACMYSGWPAASCNAEDQLRWWGPTTGNIDLTHEVLQFFSAY